MQRPLPALAMVGLLAFLALAPGCVIPRSRTVDALWYKEGEKGKARYGTTMVRIMVERNRDKEVRVGVFEEYSGAMGAEWRATVWMATFLASMIVGLPMTDRRFSVSANGYIDGPSAGALMVTAFLAALTRTRLRKEASITGGIGPDGSLLPVGGIPEKIKAAHAMKKRWVGIPAGQAMAYDVKGKLVDVIALGRKLGVEVREVRGLYGAYKLMTGKLLPLVRPLPRVMMSVDPVLGAALKRRVDKLLKMAARARRMLTGALPPLVRRALKQSDRAEKAARKYLARGALAAAYLRAFGAAGRAMAAAGVKALLGLSPQQQIERGKSALKIVKGAVKAMNRALEKAVFRKGRKPLLLMTAYQIAAVARGHLKVTRSLVKAEVEEQSKPVLGSKTIQSLKAKGKLFLLALYLSFSYLLTEMAQDALKSQLSLARRLKFRRKSLLKHAKSFLSAAVGSLKLIEALVLVDLAKEQKKSLEDTIDAFAQKEHKYLLATQLALSALITRTRKNLNRHVSLMLLASASHAYVEGAALVTKYYGLKSELTETASQEKVRRQRALWSLLQRAEVAARQAAARAHVKLGVVPPHSKLYYRAAISQMRGGHARRLRALANFWRSFVSSRMAVHVLRKRLF